MTRSALANLQILLAMVLAGCVYPIPKADRTGLPIPGPIAIGESRHPIAGGCGQYISPYWGYCDLMFEDLHGRRVDGHRIASELDREASTLPPLASWVKPVEGGKDSELPYDMYLLTISPEIVLVVPRDGKHPRNCPSVYHDGCIQSKGFRGHSYWYRSPPKVRPGSFWFSSTYGGVNKIERIDSDTLIAVDRARVRLTPIQGEWRVFREK